MQVTQNGTTGWMIALGAGVVLIGSTALRIRTVSRERARAAAAEPTVEPPSALTSAPPADAPPEVAELAAATHGGPSGPAPISVNSPPPLPVTTPPADRGDG